MGGGWVPPHWENRGEPGSPPRFRRTDWFRSQYRAIVWAKEEGSWRDLDIYVSSKVAGGGAAETPFASPSLKSEGASTPPLPPPPFLRLCDPYAQAVVFACCLNRSPRSECTRSPCDGQLYNFERVSSKADT